MRSESPETVALYQVDAFSAQPFAGNPAAVCLLDSYPDDAVLQAIAAEMNLSETAFLREREPAVFDLRWFTPAVEVKLCGHATLASAHVLWESDAVPGASDIRFHTHSGLLTASRRDDWIELDFPAQPPLPADPPPGLADALGAPFSTVAKNVDLLVELADAATVRSLRPNIERLAAVDARGVIVTAASDEPRYDFVSRFFAPRVGVPEDPVTGSAHCKLAPYWAARLGKSTLLGYQASARGGVVKVSVSGERVLIGGQAVTVVRGRLRLARS